MFTKFRNHFPDIGIVIGITLFILLFPIFAIISLIDDYFPSKDAIKFKED